MFRLILLGPAAVVVGLTAGWMVPAGTPGASSSRAPINIVPAHVVRTQPLPHRPRPRRPRRTHLEATSEPLELRHIASSARTLKSRLTATAVAKPGLRPTRCVDDDDDEC